MKKLTTDKALIFSAAMIVTFTIVMVILFCLYQTIPDSLVVAFFGSFACEGGFCAFIHKVKKDAEQKQIPDIPDDGDLVIDLDEERMFDDGK